MQIWNCKKIVYCTVRRNAGLVEVKQSSFTLRTNFTIGLICVRNKKSWTESNELCFYKATLNSHNILFLLFLATWMHYRGAGVSTKLVGTSLFGGCNPPFPHSSHFCFEYPFYMNKQNLIPLHQYIKIMLVFVNTWKCPSFFYQAIFQSHRL